MKKPFRNGNSLGANRKIKQLKYSKTGCEKQMKKVEHYVCEICHTEYAEKEKAVKCKKLHKIPKEVKAEKYRPITSCIDGVPDYIRVTFADGSSERYKRG